ncbi:monovalent cation/H(+) antiporter subunit G, partial [Agrobacterium sp.]|uniref:monovalent cation/H(+) antiporter subunit G n=1 Tax=Agrobacterium sp. TaxID=361 RepID=UPI0025C3AE08
MTGWLVAILVAALTVSGAAFSLIAAIGLNRLPDVYTRMHAASKAGTVRSGLLLLAVVIHSMDLSTPARALAGFFFFLLTAPASAHILAMAAYYAAYPLHVKSV